MTHAPSLRLILATLIGAAAGSTWAAPPSTEPDIAFTVRPADTLMGLSRTVLISPTAWREVAAINRLGNPNRIAPGQVLRIPTRLLRVASVPARLVSSVGDVRVDNQPVSATQAGWIQPGQTVQTGPASSTVLELNDGSRVRLPPSSLAQLVASQRQGAPANAVATDGWFAGTLRVVRGSVEVFATKVLRAKPLEVVTPTAVVGVRGTQFRVSHDDTDGGRGRAEVLEGQVRMDTASRESGADLPSGFGAVTDASGHAPRAAKLLPAPDLSTLPARVDTPLVRFQVPDAPATPLRVQVAADAAFDKIVSDQRVEAGAELRIAGLDDAPWHLRVRRISPEGLEGLDASHAFVLKARPEPPAYQHPRSGSKLSVGEVEFAWARNAEAPQSRLQIAEDEAFTRVVQDHGALTSTSLRSTLLRPGAYFWRLASVRANGDQGPFGEFQRLELRPQPNVPTGGLAADGRTLAFQWSGRAQDRQEVQLARDAQFTEVLAQDTLNSPEWALPTPARSGRYYFRYRSIEPDGFVSPYSEPREVVVPTDWRQLLLLAPLLLLL